VTCEYCGGPHKVHEVIGNIMKNYKDAWNHHEAGFDCWCRPLLSDDFLIHRNYDWNGEKFVAIKEPNEKA
jgi:hypothetical protein